MEISDADNYSCFAINNAGNDSVFFSLDVVETEGKKIAAKSKILNIELIIYCSPLQL